MMSMRLFALLLAAEINVFAAASLTDAMTEIGARYETASGEHVVFNFAASSTLARQIEEGAPADVFASADEEKMNALQVRGLIVASSRVSLLSNSLVIVVPRDALPIGPRDLATKSVALADPRSVPAGIYAETWLRRIGMWERMRPHVIPTDNVRAALAAVEAGNVDAAIVYRTDALHSRAVRIAYTVSGPEKPAISYPFAIVRGAPHAAQAKRFLDYLSSSAALDVFKKYGFEIGKRPQAR